MELLYAYPQSITTLLGVFLGGVHDTKFNISSTILERATAQHAKFPKT